MKLSQRIAIFLFCCLAASATHSIFAQMAAGGLRETVADAAGGRAAEAAPALILARTGIAQGFASHPLGPSTLTAETDAGFAPQQSFDSSTSGFHTWSIRHGLAQNLHSLRSSVGQEAVPEDPLQVLAPTTKK
ncbi:hypothetical protein AB4Y89_14990 [Terriglobus sp. 2YAB30_2]|uniref:hypothetical protein n=1 Tax=unclassified Terriglobus TaxID=2628988 RepID=UPI003F9B475E